MLSTYSNFNSETVLRTRLPEFEYEERNSKSPTTRN